MKAIIKSNNIDIEVDLAKPIDISIPLQNQKGSLAWYVDNPTIEPVIDGDYIGSVAKGASTNFNKITFYPHANATHTECVGHITSDFYSINKCLKQFFFLAELITIEPEKRQDDLIITKNQIEKALKTKKTEAIIIRTLPNDDSKKNQNYSNSNPAYLLEETAIYLKELGIKHLLIDLPSIDKEKDAGKLVSHKAFWNFDSALRLEATITEFIYVDSTIKDGSYLLNLQIASIENNATLSKPVIYAILNIEK
jgi:kynurenine formamidase